MSYVVFGDKPVKENGFVPAETMDPGVYFTNQFVDPPVVQLKSTLLAPRRWNQPRV